MTAPYLLRLLCLCLASFFVVNASLGLLLSVVSGRVIRMAAKMPPRSAAALLFALRLLPSGLAAAAVGGFCVPSYLLLEPNAVSEHAGMACLVMAALGASVWIASLFRAGRAVAASFRCHTSWRHAGLKKNGNLVVPSDAPLLALAGVFRQRLVISQGVLEALSGEELDVALLHENAHRISRDNLKRLLLLLAPGPLPFVSAVAALERAWTKLREWAADDEAVDGNPQRAVLLAQALVRVARMGAAPRLSFLHTSLVADDQELSERIERLLHVEQASHEPLPRRNFGTPVAALLLAGSLAILLSWPETLASVHRLLEQFLR